MPELAYVTYMPSINVTVGEKEDRMMITGMHSISDIFCVGCEEIVGWKYVRFLMIIFCDIISFVYRLTPLSSMTPLLRGLHMRGARNTRKENLFSIGDHI